MFEFKNEVINLSDNVYIKNILTNDNVYNHQIFKNNENIGSLIYKKTEEGLDILELQTTTKEDKYEILNLLFSACKDNTNISIRLKSPKAMFYFIDK